MWIIFDTLTGAQIGEWVDAEPAALEEGQSCAPLPPSAQAGISFWFPAPVFGFMDPPRLYGLEILGLYTPAQHARARRMLNEVYPEGHPWAGQLKDPDGLTQRLIDATLALKEPISVTSEFHVNGTGWMRAIGAVESDGEAARILAGIPPTSML